MKNLSLNEMENVEGGVSWGYIGGCALTVVATAGALVSLASGVGAGLAFGFGLAASAWGNNCDGVEGPAL